ncbi:hypothetical protein BD324DRAFT_100353 [Kockovaella imperatae]|uniref:Uncharacterized protein n=1 Tax=Kockovaella imperatae TaxID=4999 RepID=A0A1Y1UD55_9TREE|nr:hypothetical protein BD324DRAFT_100353 [Kockovaella imperatae]ORX35456.1 hypothetical protein BD324DRAFT_100353 [Kockovaella imperatae]
MTSPPALMRSCSALDHGILILTVLLLLTFAPLAHGMNPLWTSYYCRQQCQTAFTMCIAMAGECLASLRRNRGWNRRNL